MSIGIVGVQRNGKSNYRRYGNDLNWPIEQYHDLAMNPKVAARVAFVFFIDALQEKRFASTFGSDMIDWRQARKIVNGSDANWEKVEGLTEKILGCYKNMLGALSTK